MDLTISRDSTLPIYVQIYTSIENKIKIGEYPPGTLLPSERELSKVLNVNRSTVARVYDELFSNGLIDKKKGIGTFVSKELWPFILNTNWNKYVQGGTLLPTNKQILNVRQSSSSQNCFYDFSTNELSSEICPTNTLLKGLVDYSGKIDMSYPNSQGILELRQQLVEHMKKYYEITSTSSSILITSGSQQALYLIVQCLLNEGDPIALESPSYIGAQSFMKSANLKIHYLQMDNEGIIPSDVESLYKKHRIKMIFLNPTYQNPTGITYSEKRRKEIVDMAEKLGIPIVEGDPFSLLNFEDKIYKPIKYYDKTGNVIYIGSFSKVLGSGARIGWIVAPQSVIQRLADAKHQIDFGISIFPQIICSEFLKGNTFDTHLKNLKDALISRRNAMSAALKYYLSDQFTFAMPTGGLHIYGKFHTEEDTQLLTSSKNLFSIITGNVYGASPNYVRWSFSKLNEQEIINGIRIIANKM